MTSREDHLAWCKSRALQLVEADPAEAVASMLSDLAKWEGGEMYRPDVLQVIALDGMMFSGRSPQTARRWIEGFN